MHCSQACSMAGKEAFQIYTAEVSADLQRMCSFTEDEDVIVRTYTGAIAKVRI